jgi:tyrosinase
MAYTHRESLLSDLKSIQDDITSSLYNLLTRVNDWPGFSNHTPGDGGSSSNSLEAIHDEIHAVIGGDMGDPSVAGEFSLRTPGRRGLLTYFFL